MELTINSLKTVLSAAFTVKSFGEDGSFFIATSDWADPNNGQADNLKLANEALANAGLAESALSETENGNSSRHGMSILKELGITDVPLVVISQPHASSPQVAWSIAWTSDRGFHYTTDH